MENIPPGKDEMIRYLAKYFDTVIEQYDQRFQRRASGIMAGALSKYEKSMLKDFLIDTVIGRLEGGPSMMAAESLTNI